MIRKLFCCLLAIPSMGAFAQEPDSISEQDSKSASIFVQDPSVFRQRQAELEKMKSNMEGSNEELDSLYAQSNRIAAMHDQCSSISINDVMDDGCWKFYRVELPAFEERYMKVTGEVRLGHMAMARGLEDRKLQIEACVDALYGMSAGKDQFLTLEGGVNVEPLSQGFQANYNFALQYEPNHRKNALEIAQKWGDACREIVVRQGGEGFAPYFIESMKRANNELAERGSIAMFQVDSSDGLVLYMDLAKPIRSAYYLNGVKLFHSRIAQGPASESNLRIRFAGGEAKAEGNEAVVQKGAAVSFKGSVDYPEKATSLNGRWIWEHQANTEGVDFGPEYDADSMAVAQAEAAVAEQKAKEEQAAAETAAQNAEAESRRGFHFSPWAAVAGGVAVFTEKYHEAFGMDRNDIMKMFDLAGAVRGRVNFGEGGETFVAFGAGIYLGMGVDDEIERLYLAPLAQFEIGYRNYGFRETAVFAIPKDHSEEWMQFRSGLFYAFGYIGVEIGHSFVTNLGQGGYVSVFFEM